MSTGFAPIKLGLRRGTSGMVAHLLSHPHTGTTVVRPSSSLLIVMSRRARKARYEQTGCYVDAGPAVDPSPDVAQSVSELLLISFGPLHADTEVAGLLRASAAEFGREGYQQHRAYLNWLYRANPTGRGVADCLVARQGGEIVGCMHRMMLPLTSGGDDRLAVLHNHFVAPALRAGPGVLLLRRAVKDIAAGFAPGVQAPLDAIYRRLGFKPYAGAWLMRVLSPIAVAVQVGRARLRAPGPVVVDVEALQRHFPDLLITGRPDEDAVQSLAIAMRRGDDAAVAVDWTPALVAWRYFHGEGPKHLLVRARDRTAMAVISLGLRRGLRVARLLEMEAGADPRWPGRVRAVMRASGAAVALCFSTDPAMTRTLRADGWRMRGNDTFSFQTAGAALRLSAAASDVGFEAFNTVLT